MNPPKEGKYIKRDNIAQDIKVQGLGHCLRAGGTCKVKDTHKRCFDTSDLPISRQMERRTTKKSKLLGLL
jgi:hypothetical protein